MISICIATCNKSESLEAVLHSIRRQEHPNIEIVIVDESTGPQSLDLNRAAAKRFDVEVYQQTGNKSFRNSAYARNLATRLSTGNVLIHQSDEVYHYTEDTISKLDSRWIEGTIAAKNSGHKHYACFATVYNAVMHRDSNGYGFEQRECYTGKANPRPLFFLGMVSRELFYMVGGNDEEFTEPAYEDDFLAHCFAGHGCKFEFMDDIIGYHIDHARGDRSQLTVDMKALFDRKVAAGQIVSSNGPWPLLELAEDYR